MRVSVLSALSALVFASLTPVALVACDQDYASSTSARETFMGDTKAVPPSSAPTPPPPPPMAPPQMGPIPAPIPQMAGDASTDAPSDAARPITAPHPLPPMH